MGTRMYLAFVGAFAILGAVQVSAGERTSGVTETADRQAAPQDAQTAAWAVGALGADTSGSIRLAQRVVRGQDPAAAAPAAPAQQGNLWTFLGFPTKEEMAKKKALMERKPLHKALDGATKPFLTVLGLVPGPPPLEAPENLNSGVAALATAAKIKEEENLVPAKIQAIKYLAKIGCTCYPDVKEALLQALEDCNEKVRIEAIKALAKAECCDSEIIEKLNDIAYGTDDYGQPKEHSEKVREEAIEALETCMCEVPFITEAVPEVEREELPPAPPAERETPPMPLEQTLYNNPHGAYVVRPMRQAEMPAAAAESALTLSPSSGVIEFVDLQSGLVEIRFDEAGIAPPGARYMVFHKYPFKLAHVGDLEIVQHRPEGVIARPVGRRTLRKISKGDEIILQQ